MPRELAPTREAERILDLARNDRAAARELLRTLDVTQQVTLIGELPIAERVRLLELLPDVAEVIPLLPEAELCFVAKSVGLADAGWILEHATPTQIQACFDLDVWEREGINPFALDAWFDALADADTPTLVRGAQSVDTELLYLYLHGRIAAQLKPNEEGWDPEPGSQTLDGQFYYRSVRGTDDLETVTTLLSSLFQEDYWLYFRMMQAMSWEDVTENEEFARRWRAGRLQDLGFPAWEEAMTIYGHLRPEQRFELPEEAGPRLAQSWDLPVWMPRLPVARDARHLVFRAAAELDDEERRAFFFDFVALANRVAVADHMPLGDAESIPTAIEKSAQLVSRGLALLADHHRESATTILRRVPLPRLFRVGVSLDREAQRSVASTQ